MTVAGTTLRVMTFNIRGFYHPGDGANQWQHREALHFAMLRRCAPDLIGVQEAQTGNLKAYHRELPAYHWTAWPEYGDAPPHEWPAIYWRPDRLQPVDSGGFWLSETPERHSRSWNTDCIRSAAWVKFRCVGSGASFVHLNTHLDHRSALARVEGARLIIARLHELQHDGAAAIVTGDFNCTPGSATYRLFADAGFADADVEAGASTDPLESYTNHGWRGYPFDRPDDTPQRIDRILTRAGASQVHAESCEIIRDAAPPVYPSDHYPVLAEIALG
jgi:endonuclease/exonuclease/phosphatase family metal-dependent hydrolase